MATCCRRAVLLRMNQPVRLARGERAGPAAATREDGARCRVSQHLYFRREGRFIHSAFNLEHARKLGSSRVLRRG